MRININLKYILILFLLIGFSGCASKSREPVGNKISTDNYQISLSDGKKAIFIKGYLDSGIDIIVHRLLQANIATIEAIMYDSFGGYALESRKLHKIAKKNNLSTYALNYCSGTCITAFAGGKKRYARTGTKFEFIKLVSSGHTSVGVQHSAFIRSQNRSKNLLKKQGVGEELLRSAYDYDGKPPVLTVKQLTQGNLVHEFVSASRLSSLYQFSNTDGIDSTSLNQPNIGVISVGERPNLSNFGYQNITRIELPLSDKNLDQYDIMYLPYGWAAYADEAFMQLEEEAELIHKFIYNGGGLFVEQPNPYLNKMKNTVKPKLLPYPMTFYYEVPEFKRLSLDPNHPITKGLTQEEAPRPTDSILASAPEYTAIIKADNPEASPLFVATYGKGKILVCTHNSRRTIEHPTSERIFKRMIDWLNEGDV